VVAEARAQLAVARQAHLVAAFAKMQVTQRTDQPDRDGALFKAKYFAGPKPSGSFSGSSSSSRFSNAKTSCTGRKFFSAQHLRQADRHQFDEADGHIVFRCKIQQRQNFPVIFPRIKTVFNFTDGKPICLTSFTPSRQALDHRR